MKVKVMLKESNGHYQRVVINDDSAFCPLILFKERLFVRDECDDDHVYDSNYDYYREVTPVEAKEEK